MEPAEDEVAVRRGIAAPEQAEAATGVTQDVGSGGGNGDSGSGVEDDGGYDAIECDIASPSQSETLSGEGPAAAAGADRDDQEKSVSGDECGDVALYGCQVDDGRDRASEKIMALHAEVFSKSLVCIASCSTRMHSRHHCDWLNHARSTTAAATTTAATSVVTAVASTHP